METSAPQTALDLSTPLYYQLVYTLTDLLPPPLDHTPQALQARNRAAIAKVAALLPVTAMSLTSPPNALPLGVRPRRCCASSASTPATSGW